MLEQIANLIGILRIIAKLESINVIKQKSIRGNGLHNMTKNYAQVLKMFKKVQNHPQIGKVCI